ncbi:Zinc finger U1-type [Pyrenophora seminiperda CCB06]|uniref:Zinc finger U1-type n=1 Tax=Pyrenophora seminiperda CCB06 TaxID=1302712 RepID=A0A3M7MH56_9PLEO|nr:Zinc finger U1-type [Pyrenophora seminiperda CCB06]
MASDPRKDFPCSTCSLKFACSALQRSHMQQAWHIHNLRQKVAGIAAISEEEYDILHTAAPTTSQHGLQLHNDEARMEAKGVRILPKRKKARISPQLPMDGQEEENVSVKQLSLHDGPPVTTVPGSAAATQCLFCPNTSSTPTENLDHMSSSLHGLFIPRRDRIVDMQCFLAYLGLLVYEYRECVYCGAEKSSVQAVQTHMRDKGHCKIDDGGELSVFWENEEEEEEEEEGKEENSGRGAGSSTTTDSVKHPSGSEKHFHQRHRQPFPSNKALTQPISHPHHLSLSSPSHAKPTQHRHARRTDPAPPRTHLPSHKLSHIPPSSSSTHATLTKSNRDLSTLNLAPSQLRTLATLDRRMKTRETSVLAKRRHQASRQPVKCVYYKTENPVYQAG